MKKQVIILSASIAFLSSISVGLYYWINFDPFRKEKEAIAVTLIDPASATFRGLVRGSDAVCGYVNGKNKLGGYAGERLFIYSATSGVRLLEDIEQQTCTEPKVEMPRIYGDGMSYLSDVLAANARFKRQSDEYLACLHSNKDKLDRVGKFLEEVGKRCPGIE